MLIKVYIFCLVFLCGIYWLENKKFYEERFWNIVVSMYGNDCFSFFLKGIIFICLSKYILDKGECLDI